MISIMYAGNSGMFDGILISALSTVRYTDAQIHVFLLTMDLTDKDAMFTPINESQRKFIEGIYKSAAQYPYRNPPLPLKAFWARLMKESGRDTAYLYIRKRTFGVIIPESARLKINPFDSP